MRKSATQAVSIDCPFERAFSFIGEAGNLHLWTVDFALEAPARAGERYRVRTPRGELELFVTGDRDTGVIDFHFGRDGAFRCTPSRLVPDGDGVVYILTVFEPDGAAAGVFEAIAGKLGEELILLKRHLESPAATQEG